MYIVNGIAYAGLLQDDLEIIHVKVLEDQMLLLTFNTMERKLFDVTLLQGPVFEPLKDKNVFENTTLDNGVVTWCDGSIDCAPEYMYENGYAYE